MPKPVFNAAEFGLKLKNKMDEQRLSLRDVSKIIDVPTSTVHRVSRGGMPDLETYLRIDSWLETNRNRNVLIRMPQKSDD